MHARLKRRDRPADCSGNLMRSPTVSLSPRDYTAFLADLRAAIASYQARPHLNETILIDEPLSRYTVSRLGGSADILVRFNQHEKADSHLIQAISLCRQHAIPYRIIGGGANILFSDVGFRGLIIVSAQKWLNMDVATGIVDVSAGYALITLARETMDAGLSGLEWAISVPGTVGGAIVNNAGAHGSDMAANLTHAVLYTTQMEAWPLEKLAYTYRESALKQATFEYFVFRGSFQLDPGHDPAVLRAKAEDFIAHRKRTQPPGASLGSMFKNPPGDYAGRLIEAAGLKGRQIGGVIISPVHGNFFVNTGGGTASDYLALIRVAQETVRDKFGITLELEVEFIGAQPI